MHILWSPGRDEIGCGCNSIACAPRIGPIFTEFPGGQPRWWAQSRAPGRGAKSVTTPAGGGRRAPRAWSEGRQRLSMAWAGDELDPLAGSSEALARFEEQLSYYEREKLACRLKLCCMLQLVRQPRPNLSPLTGDRSR